MYTQHHTHARAHGRTQDVLKAVNFVHLSGNMHNTVVAAPSRYMEPAPHLRATLQRYARDVAWACATAKDHTAVPISHLYV
jgi:hypothetical protein